MEKPEKIEKIAHIRGLEPTYTGISYGVNKALFTSSRGTNIETLYNTVKKSPEITACIQAIIEDIMADGWRFRGSDFAIKNAEKFVIQSKFYKLLTNALFELLMTGDAFVLKLSIQDENMKSIITTLTKKVADKLHVKINEQNIYELVNQDLKKAKDLQLLKTSTITINYDETGKVMSYVQQVQSKQRVYQPEDVIHLSLMNIGGQPYGFTPIETLLSDVATLMFAKEFAGKYFENDGMPYFIINLPEATPDSRSYEVLKKEFKELQKSENKYKALITTGKIESTPINKFNKDMEFAKLIQHFTQLVLVALGVPAHRINLTIDVRQIGGAVNRAYEGYYKKISFIQKIIEHSLNGELWDNFHVQLNFKETYKIDEMREAQIVQIATQAGLITVEEAREMMGLDPGKPKGTEPIRTPTMNPFKGDEAAEQGKQPKEDKTDNKLKVMKSISDSLEVSYEQFIKIVEGIVGSDKFDMAKLLYRENTNEYLIYFADENWTYRTKIPKEKFPNFKEEKLRNAILILS